MSAMDIIAIEIRRAGLQLSQGRLCRAAKVAPTTYQRLLRRPGSGRISTIQRLSSALGAFEHLAAQRHPQPQQENARA